MSEEHYFSKDPKGPLKLKSIQVPIAGVLKQVSTASGTFSPQQLDVGTQVLIDQMGLVPKTGNILDLGCGWGPIALNIAKHSPKATVWAVDVNSRSLELTAKNAQGLALTNLKTAYPDDVPAEIAFSGIWSNPPIRVGKKELHEMLLRWLPRLEKNGEAYLVVQKNLGSDSLQKWLSEELADGFEVSRHTSVKTYRVIRVKKTS
jgi:16S rRNA (guanine1207-N2)-methyltransferase